MLPNTKKAIIKSVVAGLVAVGVVYGLYANSRPGRLDEFARCLGDKGAVFYGTFWCSHCQNQKEFFGKSAKLLPYVECSTPDGRGQTQVCQDKNIEGYPTWAFADGSRLSGEIPLQTLAEKTDCKLP